MGNDVGKIVSAPFNLVGDAVEVVPVVGHVAKKILEEGGRIPAQAAEGVVDVAGALTKPALDLTKDLVNDVTGARRRENKRLDEDKQRLVSEARGRVMSQKANDASASREAREANIREIMVAQIIALREAIENAEIEHINFEAEAVAEERIPNPFFAYDGCRLGTTEEIALILQPNEHYDFFMDLNPLHEAYLSYINSNISIDALRMLSEHNHSSINVSKTELSVNTLASIDVAIAEQNFEKVKRIMLASIQLEGGDVFLERVRGYQQVHQPLINAAILRYDNGIVFGELHGQAQAARIAPRPRP